MLLVKRRLHNEYQYRANLFGYPSMNSSLDDNAGSLANYIAEREFDRLTAYCPTYAEGFNQRAYVHYLRENYAAALIDLDRALALSPTHVPAQSGRALTLWKLGRIDEARTQLLEALQNNPWLSERSLLAQGGPLAPAGEDI